VRQGDHEFKASLGYTERPCLKKKRKKSNAKHKYLRVVKKILVFRMYAVQTTKKKRKERKKGKEEGKKGEKEERC
jgi:hypothetical protein